MSDHVHYAKNVRGRLLACCGGGLVSVTLNKANVTCNRCRSWVK